MITKHIQTLNETGLALIEKATTLSKIQEIERCISLGTELLEKSRNILQESKQNSILIFVEFCLHLKIHGNYSLYLEFCARNNMQMFSEEDFKKYEEMIYEKTKTKIEIEIEIETEI